MLVELAAVLAVSAVYVIVRERPVSAALRAGSGTSEGVQFGGSVRRIAGTTGAGGDPA